MRKGTIALSLLTLILLTTFVGAYTIVTDFADDKETYIKDKASELGISEDDYLKQLVESEYLADNPELPVVSIEEELTGQVIDLVYDISGDKIKLEQAIIELNKIKSSVVIGEIRK